MSTQVVVVGAGVAGVDLHLRGYTRTPSVQVVAICDQDLQRARQVAHGHGGMMAYASLAEAMVDHSPDLVSICTPPASHFEIARLALSSGINVLLEKPIFLSMEQADKVEALSRSTGTTVCAVHNQKFLPGFQSALKLEQAGRIGERINHVHAVWMVDGNEDRMIRDGDYWCHQLPGGRWQEMVPHPLYKGYQFMGRMELVDVRTAGLSGRWPWLPAEEVLITLASKTGFMTIHLSAKARKYNHMILYGSRSTVYVDSSSSIDLLDSLRPRRSLPWAWKRLLDRTMHRIRHPDAHGALIRELLEYLNGRRDAPPVTWEEAYTTLQLTLQIGEAIRRASPATVRAQAE